ncbi:purine-binding chemotaxis protein CheW [Halanaerobium congolense]|jgi:purine-binding chemotaxis protein CheW|uniref:CheW protein n=1 Tax=Halanaerobium congolense TaxID=54121 RepID=A0A1G6S2K3_9FIRM|nr:MULTISPECIES: chemotaxis protein CheW [Halanaerobium]KXS49978.1 MAG: purine-binding chemotaxis protein CheW [Halanaerobium sp. T82-1]PTX16499.1 CheW protein [Halanaerobium congolense]PUU90908.1 MAG: purine-binding chemotaxis protein CheW [Halanaerobium sp.]PUU92831.1 MAG: purine-binding chemotaxis protein CheW [Halanaerobium sp.]TDP26362.1 CheW protein [Halanaerobium congolense]
MSLNKGKSSSMAAQDSKSDLNQYVVFNIDAEQYGIKIDKTREIIKEAKITEVPNTADYVVGVINLRGIIVPVIELSRRFGIEEHIDKHLFAESEQRIITVESEEQLLGIQVDHIEGITWVEEEKIAPPPELEKGIREDYLRGVWARDNKPLLILLDLEKTLFA